MSFRHLCNTQADFCHYSTSCYCNLHEPPPPPPIDTFFPGESRSYLIPNNGSPISPPKLVSPITEELQSVILMVSIPKRFQALSVLSRSFLWQHPTTSDTCSGVIDLMYPTSELIGPGGSGTIACRSTLKLYN